MADRVADHVAGFNAAVRSRDWDAFADRFAPDARMEFVNVPAGPFAGRAAIAAGYRTNPPDDTLEIRNSRASGVVDVVDFAWTRGGIGTMTLTWTPQGLVQRLVVEFG